MPVQINGTTGVTTSKVTFNDLTSFETNNAIPRPSQANANQVLTYNGSNWVAAPIAVGGDLNGSIPNVSVTKIQGVSISNIAPTTGQVLTYNGSTNTWVASAAPVTNTSNLIEKPISPTAGQILTYNGSTNTWVASAAPVFNPATFYTTVGNASAGIFVSAACFIPSSPGTGSWTAPAGCYTARVTIVGGGGYSAIAGGRSHFNYPSGSTTGANQMFANGGQYGSGGSAGWNGINNIAVGSSVANSLDGKGGKGGSGGGGYGGAGGNGSNYGGAGGSYGRAGESTSNSLNRGGGGSGGVSGNGGDGATSAGGYGGGSPTLSYAATLLPNFSAAIAQNVGQGYSAGGGAGWCSAIVSVTPGQSYAYAIGTNSAPVPHGMVVIEW